MSKQEPPIRIGLCYPLVTIDLSKDIYKSLKKSIKLADKEDFNFFLTLDMGFENSRKYYSNPAVINSALAMLTKSIQVRGESITSDRQDVIRIAEEWSVIDNFTNGRVALSMGAPNNLEAIESNDSIDELFEQITNVRALWAGESIKRINGVGNSVELKIFPKPIQEQLPIWISVLENDSLFKRAGELGANLLIYHFGGELDSLKYKVDLYNNTLKENGFKDKHVTLMMPTYMIENPDYKTEKPFIDYMNHLINFNQFVAKRFTDKSTDFTKKNLQEINTTYNELNSLIGSKTSCKKIVNKLNQIGVNEIACIIDLSSDFDHTLNDLKYLKEIQLETAVSC